MLEAKPWPRRRDRVERHIGHLEQVAQGHRTDVVLDYWFIADLVPLELQGGVVERLLGPEGHDAFGHRVPHGAKLRP